MMKAAAVKSGMHTRNRKKASKLSGVLYRTVYCTVLLCTADNARTLLLFHNNTAHQQFKKFMYFKYFIHTTLYILFTYNLILKSKMMALQNMPQVEQLVAKATKVVEEHPVPLAAGALVGAVLTIVSWKRRELRRDGSDYNSQISGSMKILNNTDHTLQGDQFSESINDYESMFDGARKNVGQVNTEESINVRKEKYADMVNHFYNLVTDFYEWGWGQSFHFAPRFKDEGFVESLKRAEYHLCSRLGLKEGSMVADIGCGVGGPMRNIARFSGCSVQGITINQYQVNVGNKYNAQKSLGDRCKLVQGDFQNLPWADNTFDAAYEIEATCHSPDRVHTFTGVNRILKKGGLFAGYEWVMTDKYNPNDKDHVRIKEGIEVGNGLPTLPQPEHITECLEKAGFEVVEAYDAERGVHSPQEIPWYETLNGNYSLSGFRMTWLGRTCTHCMVWFLETVRIAPKGSTKVSALLNATALDLVEGGQLEIFTPSYFFLARKI